MDLTALIARVRDHYIDQFCIFIEHQKREHGGGSAEVKFEIPDHQNLFSGLYCVDFAINRDGHLVVREFAPEHVLAFDPVTVFFGKACLWLESLRWDDVVLRHDHQSLPEQELSHWFQRWFDPDDQRHDPTNELSGVVHSMSVQPGSVEIDFGTADTQALLDMIALMERAGATCLQIASGDAQAMLGAQ